MCFAFLLLPSKDLSVFEDQYRAVLSTSCLPKPFIIFAPLCASYS